MHKVGEGVIVLAAGIIQVSDSIAWVYCASGNISNNELESETRILGEKHGFPCAVHLHHMWVALSLRMKSEL